jgi:predicted phosphodiesterase
MRTSPDKGTSPDAPTRRRQRVILPLVIALLVGAAGSVAAWFLFPPVEGPVGPARLEARPHAGSGQTTLRIPPLGEVRAHTHTSFLSVGLSVTEVDVNGLGQTFSSERNRLAAVGEVEESLRSLAISLGVRMLLGGAVAGAVILAILPRRRRRYVAAGAVGGLLAAGIAVGATASTFNVDAFREPRFTGALTRAPIVIEALSDQSLTLDEVRSRYSNAAARLSGLLELMAEPDLDPRNDTQAVLHISDIHSNPVGLEIAQQLVDQFGVEAVLDTGDLTNFGLSVEQNIARLVDRFDVPYYFVPGNHDSDGVQRALAATEGVTVLDGTTAEIAGATVLGWRDPTYTNWNRLPPDEAALVREEEAGDVASAVQALAPDILAVHDHRVAEASYGHVPFVVSGHYHRQILEEHDGTYLLAVGTSGAAGLKSFTVDADQNYEAEILYLRDGAIAAIDYVRFTGLGSDFVIERKTLDPLVLDPRPEVSPEDEGLSSTP